MVGSEKLGGGEERVTTYHYDKKWTDGPVDSSSFKDPDFRNKNKGEMTHPSRTFKAKNVQLGPPYSRGDHMSVMYQHVQGKAKLCQEINPEIPDDYAALIAKAMSVDKTKRFQSMDELTEALDHVSL